MDTAKAAQQFRTRLQELGHSSYKSYLDSDHWKQFRAVYRKSSLTQVCAVCGILRVHLHHHTYERLGCERVTDVTPLCELHHDAVHKLLNDKWKLVQETPWAVGVLRGQLPLPVPKPKKAKKTTHPDEPQHSRGKRKTRARLVTKLKRKKRKPGSRKPKPIAAPPPITRKQLERAAANLFAYCLRLYVAEGFLANCEVENIPSMDMVSLKCQYDGLKAALADGTLKPKPASQKGIHPPGPFRSPVCTPSRPLGLQGREISEQQRARIKEIRSKRRTQS